MATDSSLHHPNTAIGYLLRRVYQLGQEALAPIFAAEKLTSTQWSTMAVVLTGHCITCADIARDLGHDKGAMTRIIDQLADRGLVTRQRDEGDRRHVRIALTPEGEAVTMRVKAQVVAAWDGWLGEWEAADVEQLISSLQRLKITLTEARGEAA